MTQPTAEQVDLMARGALEQHIAKAKPALVKVLAACGITLDDDQHAIADMAIIAGMLAGTEAITTVLRALGKDIPELGPGMGLDAWVDKSITAAQEATGTGT